MREIAAGKGSGLSRAARQAMTATPAGRETLRRIESGEGIPSGSEIVTRNGGKGYETVKARRRGRINTAEERKRLDRLAAENRR